MQKLFFSFDLKTPSDLGDLGFEKKLGLGRYKKNACQARSSSLPNGFLCSQMQSARLLVAAAWRNNNPCEKEKLHFLMR